MPVLAREEKETIITFDESPADAIIFTYNKTWQQILEKRLGLKPISNNGLGAREYQIPKSRIKPPKAPKKISAATRERLRKQGMAHRQKSPNPSNSSTAQPLKKGKRFSASNSSNRTKTKSKNTQKSGVK